MAINEDGIKWALSPYQRLILWGLWAILSYLNINVRSDENLNTGRNIRNLLFECADHGFVTGDLKAKVFE